MTDLALITGGAGFIGLHLSRELVKIGYRVRIFDNFSPQVHAKAELPSDLLNNVELVVADVRDQVLLRKALMGVSVIVHLAAETGTGQSMYSVAHYSDVNIQGAANLLDILMNDKSGGNVRNIIVASSRSVYGEGAYRCLDHGVVYPGPRENHRLESGLFDPVCPKCKSDLLLIPTPETAELSPLSIYAMTKLSQEQAFLICARAKEINGFALRYQNVYGPGQSMHNPYTGILAVFSNLIRQKRSIEVYEDGEESRDFIYIDDVIEVTKRAIAHPSPFVGAINVGSGISTSINQVAEIVKSFFNSDIRCVKTGIFRAGDIRHNLADLNKLKQVLDFKPQETFKDGATQFLSWAQKEVFNNKNSYENSKNELIERGLLKSVLKNG